MVYLDYEAGSSTRIDQIRSTPVTLHINAGGTFNHYFALTTSGLSFYYFYRKFKNERFGILGALALSIALGNITRNLGEANFGLPYQTYNYSGMSYNMTQIQNDDLKEIEFRREKQRDKIIDNMGKV